MFYEILDMLRMKDFLKSYIHTCAHMMIKHQIIKQLFDNSLYEHEQMLSADLVSAQDRQRQSAASLQLKQFHTR